MLIRTYRGSKMSDIVNMIRERHGDGALILSVKERGAGTIEVSVGIRNVRTAAEKKLHAAMLEAQTAATQRTMAWLARRGQD